MQNANPKTVKCEKVKKKYQRKSINVSEQLYVFIRSNPRKKKLLKSYTVLMKK